MARKLKDDRDYILWMLLTQTRNIVYKAREKELGQYGITPEQAGTLFAIHSVGKEATIAEIGLQLVREPHSVANLLSRMEHHGLVIRKKPRDGRRAATYQLTPKGLEAYGNSTRRESLHKAMSGLSKEEGEKLEMYLRKILHTTLKDMVNAMKPPWP